jgi:hypothetical protein
MEQAWKRVEMKLSEKQLESLIINRSHYNDLMNAQRSLQKQKGALVKALYEELKLAVPGLSKEDLCGFLELEDSYETVS